MADTSMKQGKGPRGWVRWIFVASLALNLLVIGAVGSAMVAGSKWKHHHGKSHYGSHLGGGPLTRALSNEDRRALWKRIKGNKDDWQAQHAAHVEELRGFIADLRAVPFDPASIAPRLDRVMDKGQRRLGNAKVILGEHLIEMAPEERAAYADRLEQVLERKDKR